jgi:hypothetical protein
MRWLLWWRPPCLLKVVIVNVKHDPDTAFRGVLWQARGPWLTLRSVDMFTTGNQFKAVDGEVVLHRDNVSFVQVLP